ncbi:MAG: efflux RND transporter periplasmic adaptor subunit [Verrucomicrobiota bacterium]
MKRKLWARNTGRRSAAGRRFLLTTGLLVVLGIPWSGCGRETPKPATEADAPPAPIAVRVAVARSGGDPVTEDVVGTVRSRLQAQVESKVAGRVEFIRADPGQKVQAGDVLVRLDAREWTARRDQALAVREQADRDLDRVSRLVRDGAATASELDAVRARQRVAAANEAEAETLLGQLKVVAPFDGVVTRKRVDVGDLAVPGRPLVDVEDPSRLRFEADVPEALVDHVSMGLRLPVRVSAAVDPLEGVVSEVAPVADPATRTYLVRLDLPSVPGLRTGQFGRVAIPMGPATGIYVPTSAVTQRGQLERVFVVSGGRAHLRLVRTGRRSGDSVEVDAGLKAGETVVVDDSDTLRDGQEVSVR